MPFTVAHVAGLPRFAPSRGTGRAAATALEKMMKDMEDRDVRFLALVLEIQTRFETTRAAFVEQDEAFANALSAIAAAQELDPLNPIRDF